MENRNRPVRPGRRKPPAQREERVREKRARYGEPTVSTTVRLRSSLRRSLEALASRGRQSVSEVVQQLVDEGIRLRECPGIYFASEPSGRTAKIAGTGLAVWEVLRDFVRDEDAERLREGFPQLSRAQITAALMYYNRNAEEVRSQVEANVALTPGGLDRRYPGLVRVLPLG